jgi:deoxyribose-phosphate aldolase
MRQSGLNAKSRAAIRTSTAPVTVASVHARSGDGEPSGDGEAVGAATGEGEGPAGLGRAWGSGPHAAITKAAASSSTGRITPLSIRGRNRMAGVSLSTPPMTDVPVETKTRVPESPWSPQAAEAAMVRVTPVDAVGLEERAASLATRSIKREAKRYALDLAIRCADLTTLEGADTPGKVIAVCSKAVRPDPTDPTIPSVAAVVVYPSLVPVAADRLKGTGVKVASVAGGFPSGLSPLEERLDEISTAVQWGADEIDIVLNRSAFLAGRYHQAYEEVARSKEACGSAHLKVILETGELGSYDQIRKASMLAMAAGADVIKTSTGKIGVSSTYPSALCMMEAARDFHRQTGRAVGIKVAGGIKKAKEAWTYLVILHETLGPDWLTPDRFRIGASTLLNDLLMQVRKEREGRYQGPDYFTID